MGNQPKCGAIKKGDYRCCLGWATLAVVDWVRLAPVKNPAAHYLRRAGRKPGR
jgi:hypothetical protein